MSEAETRADLPPPNRLHGQLLFLRRRHQSGIHSSNSLIERGKSSLETEKFDLVFAQVASGPSHKTFCLLNYLVYKHLNAMRVMVPLIYINSLYVYELIV